VVGAMAGRPVPVPPAAITGQQLGEGSQEVVVAARTGLDDRKSGRSVGHEDRHEAISPVPAEVADPAGQVDHRRRGPGRDGELDRVHGAGVSSGDRGGAARA
jgi:hypothetical protein